MGKKRVHRKARQHVVPTATTTLSAGNSSSEGGSEPKIRCKKSRHKGRKRPIEDVVPESVANTPNKIKSKARGGFLHAESAEVIESERELHAKDELKTKKRRKRNRGRSTKKNKIIEKMEDLLDSDSNELFIDLEELIPPVEELVPPQNKEEEDGQPKPEPMPKHLTRKQRKKRQEIFEELKKENGEDAIKLEDVEIPLTKSQKKRLRRRPVDKPKREPKSEEPFVKPFIMIREGQRVHVERLKRKIRVKIWTIFDKLRRAATRYSTYATIPAFNETLKAANRLLGIREFNNAQSVCVFPNRALEDVRRFVLEQGKTLYVLSPDILDNEVLIRRIRVRPEDVVDKKVYHNIVVKHMLDHVGEPIPMTDDVKIDFVVRGAVAVSKVTGQVVGSGKEWADLQLTMLKEMNFIDNSTPIVTVVHEDQLHKKLMPEQEDKLFTEFDVPVDFILTPQTCVKIVNRPPRPQCIIWEKLSTQRLEFMPTLQQLQIAHQRLGDRSTATNQCLDDRDKRDLHLRGKKNGINARRLLKDPEFGLESKERQELKARIRDQDGYLIPDAVVELFTLLNTERTDEEKLHQCPFRPTDYSIFVCSFNKKMTCTQFRRLLIGKSICPVRIFWKGAEGYCILRYNNPTPSRPHTPEEIIEIIKNLDIQGRPDIPLRVELADRTKKKGYEAEKMDEDLPAGSITIESVDDLIIKKPFEEPTKGSITVESVDDLIIEKPYEEPPKGSITVESVDDIIIEKPYDPPKGSITVESVDDIIIEKPYAEPLKGSITVESVDDLIFEKPYDPPKGSITVESVEDQITEKHYEESPKGSITVESVEDLITEKPYEEPPKSSITVETVEDQIIDKTDEDPTEVSIRSEKPDEDSREVSITDESAEYLITDL